MVRVRHRAELVDLALAGAVAAVEFADMYLFGDAAGRGLLDALLLAASAAALLLRRRFPYVCLVLAGAAVTALAARDATHVGLGAIAATYAVAAFGSAPARRVAAAQLLVAIWLVPLLTDDSASIPRNVALFGGAWALGQLMRERRDQHEQLLELATAAERARLAQEVHDVLTHSVSVMVVQAQGAQVLEDEPDRVRLALQRIESTGRDALGDLRALLREGSESDDGDGSATRRPAPGLAGLGELARATRDAGIEVALDVQAPTGALPATLELSAYRIVQEALTNVLRHSGAQAARVAVRCREHVVEIEVVDDGRGGPAAAPREGRGITGMRSRAAAAGGSLEAAGIDGGGFRVLARLPVAR